MIAIIAILAAILFPVLGKVQASAHRAQCTSNIRQLGIAVHMYLMDYDHTYFPYYYDLPDVGRQWYFGLEKGYGQGFKEGARDLDKTRSLLFPYIQHTGGVEMCASFPYHSAYWKPKFSGASYGYGYNIYGLASDAATDTGDDSRTILFADCAQVNTFQTPASPDNPMLEEFYYVSPYEATVHFRHNGRAVVLFCDGHVELMGPYPGSLDPRCDGEVGMLCARGDGRLFNVK